uniref:Uncharacterized protein n=1 Tax=Anguilla anguilla TaxID=7936 RepID=A0A0E9U5T6_ANGAN
MEARRSGTYKNDLDRKLCSPGVVEGSIPTARKIPVRALCSF